MVSEMSEFKRTVFVEGWIASITEVDPTTEQRDYRNYKYYEFFPTKEGAINALEEITGKKFSTYANSVYFGNYEIAEVTAFSLPEHRFERMIHGR